MEADFTEVFGTRELSIDATTARAHSSALITDVNDDGTFEREKPLAAPGTDDPKATSKFASFTHQIDSEYEGVAEVIAHTGDVFVQSGGELVSEEFHTDNVDERTFVAIVDGEAVELTEEDVFEHFGVEQTDEEDDDDEPELVTDGGQPTVDEEFSDSDIQTAIDDNGAETDVEEVREVLRMIQESVEEVWDLHMDSVEENGLELVSMDDDVLVFADHTGQFWNSEFENGPLAERDLPPRMKSVVSQIQHGWAMRRSGYEWSVDDPVVVRKPADFDAGQRLVEAVMLNLTSRGLSPRQAWSVWGVLAGNSRNNWAARMGYDSHSGVSNAVREAKEKIPLSYIGQGR